MLLVCVCVQHPNMLIACTIATAFFAIKQTLACLASLTVYYCCYFYYYFSFPSLQTKTPLRRSATDGNGNGVLFKLSIKMVAHHFLLAAVHLGPV